MHLDLPAGYAARPLSVDDVDAVYAVLSAADTAVVGAPDMTRDDVRDELTEPGFDPATGGWLVLGPDGGPAAYAWVAANQASALIDIEVRLHPRTDVALGPLLLDAVVARGAEIGRELGHAEVLLHQGVHRADATAAATLAAAGFTLATTFHRMSIDLDGPVPVPPLSSAVRVRRSDADEADLRAAHRIREESFAEHFGNVARSYEEWKQGLDARSDVDFSQLWLAELGGEPVGMLLGSDAMKEDLDAGFVLTLGVLKPARGRGLGRALLLTAFEEMRLRGRRSVALHVDEANVTDAVGLYESVGMHRALSFDVWERTVATA